MWSEGLHFKWIRGNGSVSSLYVPVRSGAMAGPIGKSPVCGSKGLSGGKFGSEGDGSGGSR